MKTTIIISTLSAYLIFGARSYGQATQSDDLAKVAGSISDGKTARNLGEEAIAAKGWQQGVNKKKDGSKFFVALTTGDIQAPIDNPAYLTSRANAYDKAMLSAWAEIRKFVSQEVSANAKSAYQEAAGGIQDKSSKETPTEAKAKALVNGLLDKSLEKLGIDPKSANPEQREKAISTEDFSKQMSTVANGPIIGVQTYSTFEGRGGGKGYQIAVIAIWSDKLQKMAESMLTLSAMPSGVPGKAIQEWVPQDEKELMTTFGVQMVSDEGGNPVLLSYGQSSAISESSRSVDAAYSKAQLEALASLRFFAGAQAKAREDYAKAESTQEFADATKTYESSESFKQTIEAVAPPQKFSGVSKFKTWSCVHPITKKKILGTVVQWRPEDALVAGDMGGKMAKRPTSAGPNQVLPPKRQSLDASDKGRTGKGVTAGDDF
jgi:hypothetical protein